MEKKCCAYKDLSTTRVFVCVCKYVQLILQWSPWLVFLIKVNEYYIYSLKSAFPLGWFILLSNLICEPDPYLTQHDQRNASKGQVMQDDIPS